MALNTKTVQNLMDYIRRQFGDESGVQLEDDDLIRWCNQGLMEIVSKNKILRATATSLTVTGQDTYTKPTDSLQIQAVKYNSMMLAPVGFDEFQRIFTAIAVNTPATQVVAPAYWTQFGENLIIGSAPTVDGDTLTVYYVPEPPVMAGGGTVLPIPDRYFDRLCEYCMSKAYELDEDWNGHTVQRDMFEKNLVAQNVDDVNMTGPFPVVQDVMADW